MTSKIFIKNYGYFQILSKKIIKNKGFHFILSLLDTLIIILIILDIYQSNYNSNPNNSIKYLKITSFFSNKLEFCKLLILIIYLIFGYTISIFYTLSNVSRRDNKFDIILINFFEFFLVRLLFTFFCEFLFSLNSLYFIFFFLLTIPFFTFILIDINYFHLTGFMFQMIDMSYDDFTSLCDLQKIIIKIFISISRATTSINICKFMFFSQFILFIFFLLYDTYIIFNKSYYLMNNEFITKTKYANLLSLVIIQILMFLMNPEEIFEKLFLNIFSCIIIFVYFFIFLFYNPYNHIIIHTPENIENVYYYFFVLDTNKNNAFFLEEKIKDHIFKCNCCSLCSEYQILMNDDINNDNDNKNIIEFEKNKEIDMFNILYTGKDKSMILFNYMINSIKKLGNNSLYNNSYYIINLIYLFYYSSENHNITFSLNHLLIFNFIQENNKAIIANHRMSINQILYINKFLILSKQILSIIKEIITKNIIKRYLDKFFELSKILSELNNSKFKENLLDSKIEGVTNNTYLVTICSLLYEEIFNKTFSSYSIPIRENSQLHEDILKHFYEQNNNIINLNFNLKTIECKIIYAGKDLFYHTNTNFYDLFPNQIKENLIKNFFNNIINCRENKFSKKKNKNNKQYINHYIEPNFLIVNKINNYNFYRTLHLKLSLLFNDYMKENILLFGYYHINEFTLITYISKGGSKEKMCGYGNKDIMDTAFQNKLNFDKFKESDYMNHKTIQYAYSISIKNDEMLIYNIHENKRKKKKKT